MKLHPVRTERDCDEATARIEQLMGAKFGTREFDELEILATLVEDYEKKNHPIGPPDPIAAILFGIEQGQFTRADLTRVLGGTAKTTEVLKKQRALSKAMIARLHVEFAIPLESLLGDMLNRGRPRGPRRLRSKAESPRKQLKVGHAQTRAGKGAFARDV